jgi:hypothetical protein
VSGGDVTRQYHQSSSQWLHPASICLTAAQRCDHTHPPTAAADTTCCRSGSCVDHAAVECSATATQGLHYNGFIALLPEAFFLHPVMLGATMMPPYASSREQV